MEEPERERAIRATTGVASAAGLTVGEARLVGNSNKLGLRLLPCDVFARVAVVGHEVFDLEIELAQRLVENHSPVVPLDPRVEPRVYERDGFAVTFWRYHEQSGEASPEAFAGALARLHAGMAHVDVATPNFRDRVAEAQELVASLRRTPLLEDSDRELLRETLESCGRWIDERAAPEQLLHGEPHPGNLLNTPEGQLFVDLETCCRGPIEFDLAHAPEAVSDCYPGADRELLRECRRLVLAMVAAWRWDVGDEFPDRERAGRVMLSALRAGPPWPTLDAVMQL
jgi:hypothetical protein